VIYAPIQHRIYADLDNERVDSDVVGISKTDFVKKFDGSLIEIKEHDYVYLFMDIIDDDGSPSYVFSEGVIICNPYSFKPYKWCCRLISKIEYIEEYMSRHFDASP
jgi:hypothetical protein